MASSGQGRNIAGTVGRNIRKARRARDLTQRELALLHGGKIDGQRISDWERGYNRPNDRSLVRLAEVFGVDIAWFFVDHDDEALAA